ANPCGCVPRPLIRRVLRLPQVTNRSEGSSIFRLGRVTDARTGPEPGLDRSAGGLNATTDQPGHNYPVASLPPSSARRWARQQLKPDHPHSRPDPPNTTPLEATTTPP